MPWRARIWATSLLGGVTVARAQKVVEAAAAATAFRSRVVRAAVVVRLMAQVLLRAVRVRAELRAAGRADGRTPAQSSHRARAEWREGGGDGDGSSSEAVEVFARRATRSFSGAAQRGAARTNETKRNGPARRC